MQRANESLAQAEVFILQVELSLPKYSSNLAAASPLLLSWGTGNELQLDELLSLCMNLALGCCCSEMRPAQKVLLRCGFITKDVRTSCLLTELKMKEMEGRMMLLHLH